MQLLTAVHVDVSYKNYRGIINTRFLKPTVWYKGKNIELDNGELVIGRRKSKQKAYWYVLPISTLLQDPEAAGILRNPKMTWRVMEPIASQFVKEFKID